MADHRSIISKHYIPRLSRFSESHQVLDWESREAQETRFAVLADTVELEGSSLLDVGCGLGDLYGYLKTRGIDCLYTGIDLLEDMAIKAFERFPDARFLHGDMFSAALFEAASFDFVFTSGIFNLNMGNNCEFMQIALPVMLKIARKALVFNMLHTSSPDPEDKYYYYDPDLVLKFLQDAGYQPRLVGDYLGNDFTVCCPIS